jgi:tetratricopeptide (TPR) repeat protein
MLWPDEPLSKGRASLRRELYNLTQLLPDCWRSDRQAVAFVPSTDINIDIYMLLELEAQEDWIQAADLLGGEFLEALYLENNIEFENWLAGERDRWQWRTEMIFTRVIEGHILRGRYRDALQYSQRLLKFFPWKEETHRQAMRLLTWTGQRGAALRQFETCKQFLKSELDVEPSEDIVTLFRQIQAGELDLPPQLPAFLVEEAARHEIAPPLIVAREHEMKQLNSALDKTMDGQGRVIFVSGGPGRGKTVLMEAFARQAMDTHANLLVASGNCNAYSGIGDPYLPFRDIMAMLTGDVELKWDSGAVTREHASRLWEAFPIAANALLDHAPNSLDVLVHGKDLLSRAAIFELTSSAPWPLQIAELVKHQQASMKIFERSYLYQQITNMLQAIAKQQPLLLIMDDMQWADTASISLLFHLGRRLAESASKILILCAIRPEEVFSGREGERHPLVKLLNEFKRSFGDEWVELVHAEEQDARKFVDAILDIESNKLPESFRVAMLQRTGAHPLFTVELLRAMQERGDLFKDEKGYWVEASKLDWNLLPTKVEAVIEERIERLDPTLQEILTIASIEGESFTAEVVAEVQEQNKSDLLRQLSMSLEQQHRLVREQEGLEINGRYLSRFKFSHVLFQNYFYKRLCQGERRILHTSVANAIEKLYGSQLNVMAVQLAHHLHQAGDYCRAFLYYIHAAERAANIYANDEAITHYSQAIDLASKVSPDAISLATIYQERGRVYEILGKFNLALNDLETGLEFSNKVDDHLVKWRILVDLGKLWSSRDYNLTKGYFEKALNLARSIGTPENLSESLNWIGNWHTNADESQIAVMYHQEALAIVEKLNIPQELANTMDLLGITNLMGGNFRACIKNYKRSIALFRELGDRSRLVSSLTGRAATFSMLAFLASVPTSSLSQASHDIKEAIQIASEIGSASDESWAYWASGLAHTVSGHFGEAIIHLEKGLQLATEIEHSEFIVGNRFALGALSIELFDLDQAVDHLKESLDIAENLDSRTLTHISYGALAGVYLAQDSITLAQNCLDDVISDQTAMDTVGKRYCWVRRAEIAFAQEDPEFALDIINRLISTAPGIEPDDVITFLWMLKGKSLTRLGLYNQATTFLTAAIDNAQKKGEKFLLWRAHTSLGHLYKEMGLTDSANNEFSTASTFIDELAATIPEKTITKKFLAGSRKFLI